MKFGLFTLGIGAGADPAILRAVASNAERVGISTLWVGEHVVLFDRHESKYPYSETGQFAVPAHVDWLDPFITLTYAAAVTSKIRLATGICLLPEHSPLVLAKEIASLDKLSGGRFAFGVGIGWLAEEFAALGVPFERRAQRTREYIDVMRRMWSDEVVSYRGEFVRLEFARQYPKPARGARLPILFGGESGPALRRTADIGDGWFGFNLDPAEAKRKVDRLRELLKKNGRDPKSVEIVVSPYTKKVTPDDLARYRECGVDEVVMVAGPPDNAAKVPAWLDLIGRDWVNVAAKL